MLGHRSSARHRPSGTSIAPPSRGESHAPRRAPYTCGRRWQQTASGGTANWYPPPWSAMCTPSPTFRPRRGAPGLRAPSGFLLCGHMVNIRGNSYRIRRRAELSKAIHATASRAVSAEPAGNREAGHEGRPGPIGSPRGGSGATGADGLPQSVHFSVAIDTPAHAACQLHRATSSSTVALTNFHPQPQAPATLSTSAPTGWTACRTHRSTSSECARNSTGLRQRDQRP